VGGRLPVVWGVELIDKENREMGGPLAFDGRHLMWGHSNQPKVVVVGEGGVREETRPGRNMWGRLSHCLGRRIEQRIKKLKYSVALDGRRLMIYYATTNQNRASTMKGGMKERCDEQEARGKHNVIFWGA
jgi:hypothetical protein